MIIFLGNATRLDGKCNINFCNALAHSDGTFAAFSTMHFKNFETSFCGERIVPMSKVNIMRNPIQPKDMTDHTGFFKLNQHSLLPFYYFNQQRTLHVFSLNIFKKGKVLKSFEWRSLALTFYLTLEHTFKIRMVLTEELFSDNIFANFTLGIKLLEKSEGINGSVINTDSIKIKRPGYEIRM